MDLGLRTLIEEALQQPKDAVSYFLSRRLAEAFPECHILETDDRLFGVERFAHGKQCELARHPGIHSELDTDYNGSSKSYWTTAYNAWQTVQWKKETIEVITVAMKGFSCTEYRHFIVAANSSVAIRFFVDVCNWNAEVRGEVLVWSDGWHKDAGLFKAIQASTFDGLVLEGDLMQQIRTDFETFFKARKTYEQYQIPWKRGVLLLGPPGNGKTHCIKALVNHLKVPCLYVKTFARERGTEQDSIRRVFDRARDSAPCLLVLEDLDTLLREQNRSFFLNEMDGFAANSGLMVVGTTNHPERLDPAILERPSRFDRKYTFNLPEVDCRRTYLMTFSRDKEEALRLTYDEAHAIAERTDGFSFAYLKELYLSAMMVWVSRGQTGSVQSLMDSQVDNLRAQMHTSPVAPSLSEPEGKESSQEAMARYMSRWKK